MPCGGIIKMLGPGKRESLILPRGGGCWMCDKGGCTHFIIEWDAYIHARCIPAFLQTDEGKILINHGHTVYIDFSLEPGEEAP